MSKYLVTEGKQYEVIKAGATLYSDIEINYGGCYYYLREVKKVSGTNKQLIEKLVQSTERNKKLTLLMQYAIANIEGRQTQWKHAENIVSELKTRLSQIK